MEYDPRTDSWVEHIDADVGLVRRSLYKSGVPTLDHYPRRRIPDTPGLGVNFVVSLFFPCSLFNLLSALLLM